MVESWWCHVASAQRREGLDEGENLGNQHSQGAVTPPLTGSSGHRDDKHLVSPPPRTGRTRSMGLIRPPCHRNAVSPH